MEHTPAQAQCHAQPYRYTPPQAQRQVRACTDTLKHMKTKDLPRKPLLPSFTWVATVCFHVSRCIIWKGIWEMYLGSCLQFYIPHWKSRWENCLDVLWKKSNLYGCDLQMLFGSCPHFCWNSCPRPCFWSSRLRNTNTWNSLFKGFWA